MAYKSKVKRRSEEEKDQIIQRRNQQIDAGTYQNKYNEAFDDGAWRTYHQVRQPDSADKGGAHQSSYADVKKRMNAQQAYQNFTSTPNTSTMGLSRANKINRGARMERMAANSLLANPAVARQSYATKIENKRDTAQNVLNMNLGSTSSYNEQKKWNEQQKRNKDLLNSDSELHALVKQYADAKRMLEGRTVTPIARDEHIQSLGSAAQALRDKGLSRDDIYSMIDTYERWKNESTTREMKNITDDISEMKGGNALLSAGAVVSTLGNGRGMEEAIGRGVSQAATGKYNPMDVNSTSMMGTNFQNYAKDKVTKDIEESVENGTGNRVLAKGAGMVYNAGLSVAESALSAVATGGMGATAMLGASAASASAQNAFNRTGNSTRAMVTGLASGGIEAITEKFSLDSLYRTVKNAGAGAARTAVAKYLTQAGIEGSEEGASDIANLIVDRIVNGNMSDYDLNVQAYMENGMSQAEAKKQATKDFLGGMAESIAMGAMSGGMSSTGAQVLGAQNARATGRYLENDGSINGIKKEDVISHAESTDDKVVARRLAKYQEGGNSADLGRLYGAVSEFDDTKKAKKQRSYKEVKAENEAVARVQEAQTPTEMVQAVKEAEATGNEVTATMANEVAEAKKASYSLAEKGELNIASDNVVSVSEAREIGLKGGDINRDLNTEETNRAYDEALEDYHNWKTNAAQTDTTKHSSVILNDGTRDAITGVKELNGADTVFTTQSGKEVKFEDVDSFAVTKFKDIYEYALSQKDADIANAIIDSYTVNTATAKAYIDGFDSAFKAGQSGYRSFEDYIENTRTTNAVMDLPKSMLKTAFELGQTKNDYVPIKQDIARKGTGTYTNKSGAKSVFDPVLNMVAKKLGIDIEYTDVDENGNSLNIYDENGNVVGTKNGYFNSQTGKLILNYNGNAPVFETLVHEIAEFTDEFNPEAMQNVYEAVTKFAYERLGEKQANDAIKKLKEAYENNGEKSWQDATREFCNNELAYIMSDASRAEQFIEWAGTELTDEEKNSVFDAIIKILQHIVGVIRNSNSYHQVFAGRAQELDDIANMFIEALGGAVKTYAEAGVTANEDTAVAASPRFSVRTTLAETWDNLKYKSYEDAIDGVSQKIADQIGVTHEEAKKWVQAEETIASIIFADSMYLDYVPDDEYEAVKKNSDYPQGTVDFNNLCRKREIFTNLFDALQKKNKNRIYTAQDIATIRQVMAEREVEVACALCYVEDRRQRMGEIADEFIGYYKEALASDNKRIYKKNYQKVSKPLIASKAQIKKHGLKAREGDMRLVDSKNAKNYGQYVPAVYLYADDDYVPTQYDLITYQGFADLKKNHPSIAIAFENYNNSRGMASARLIEGRAEYKRDILKYTKNKVKSINNKGGLRMFSFSDFQAVHLLDLAQIITDCAAMGVKVQTYTKVPEFAKLIENTGIKCNRSLIPATPNSKKAYSYVDGEWVSVKADEDGIATVNGKEYLAYDTVEGIDVTSEYFNGISEDNPDIGNIVIGISKKQISLAMVDPMVDYIIPFHTGQTENVLKTKGISHWGNYKDVQEDKKLPGSTARGGVNIYTAVLNRFNPTNKQDFVKGFLKVCKERKLDPRFSDFLNHDENGDYSYREGYHKLLLDFKMFDREGNILPQNNIRPEFDMDVISNILAKEVEDAKGSANAVDNETMDAIEKALDANPRYSISSVDSEGKSLTKEQQEFFKDSKVRDEKGRLKVMYHGTRNAGFTIFDPSKSKDRISLFFTDRKSVARSYNGNIADDFIPDKNYSFNELYEMLDGVSNGDYILSKTANGYSIDDVLGEPEETFESLNEVRDYIIENFVEIDVSNETPGVYNVYINMKNPYVVDAKNLEWNNLQRIGAENADDIAVKVADFYSIFRKYDINLTMSDVVDSIPDIADVLEGVVDEEPGIWIDAEIKRMRKLASDIYEYYEKYDEEEHLDEDGEPISFESYISDAVNPVAFDSNTREYAEYAKTNGYDGVIFNNIMDNGAFSENNYETSQVVIVFEANQVKSVENTKPTTNPDIRYSIVAFDSEHTNGYIPKEFKNAKIENDDFVHKDEFGVAREEVFKVVAKRLKNNKSLIYSYSVNSRDHIFSYYNYDEDSFRVFRITKIEDFKDALEKERTNATKDNAWIDSIRNDGQFYNDYTVDAKNTRSDGQNGEISGGESANGRGNNNGRSNTYYNGLRYTVDELLDLDKGELESQLYMAELYDDTENKQIIKDLLNGNRGKYENRRYSISIDGADSSILDDNPTTKKVAKVIESGIKAIKGKEVDEKQVRKIAKYIRNIYGSTVAENTLYDNIYRAMDYIQNADGVNFEEAVRALNDIALDAIENSGKIDMEQKQRYDSFKAYLKPMRIRLNEEQKAEAKSVYDNYNTFRMKAMGNGIIFSNDGMPLDGSMWNEICDHSHGMLSRDTNSTEQGLALLEAMELLKPQIVHEYTDNEGVALELTMDILERYFQDRQVKQEIAEERDEYKENLKRKYREGYRDGYNVYKAKHTEKEHDRKVRELKNRQKRAIQREAKALRKWLDEPTNKQHVPEYMNTVVDKFLKGIGYNGTDDYHATNEWRTYLNDVYNMLDYNNATSFDSDVASIIAGMDPDFRPTLYEILNRNKDKKFLTDMSVADIRDIHLLTNALKASVQRANKALSDGKQMEISEIAHADYDSNVSKKNRKELNKYLDWFRKALLTDMVDANTFFNTFGKGSERLWEGLKKGWNRKVFHIKEVDTFKNGLDEKYGRKNVDKWLDADTEAKEYTINDKKVYLRDDQLMELYVLSKRDQALKHLFGDGFNAGVVKYGKKRIKQGNIAITNENLMALLDKLSDEQKAFADEMQSFLSNEVSEWGNRTSMLMYGYKKFKEKFYWPIRVDNNSVATLDGTQDGKNAQTNLFAMQNMGMTKSLNKNATNALTLDGIGESFLRHTVDMANYDGLVAPINDIIKWFNYKERRSDFPSTYDGLNIKNEIERLRGAEGKSYIVNLIMALNGESRNDISSPVWKGLIGAYKGAAIGANIRVVVQQPTAIVRALMVLDAQDLMKGFKNPAQAINEASDLSADAFMKSNGYYDAAMGRSMRQIILNKSTKIEGIKDKSSILAAMADKLTWGVIWNACKANIDRTQPNLTGDAYMEAVTELFDKTIDDTQVIDSVIHRTQVMRSKSELAQMATAFMSEPHKAYNMLLRAVLSGDKKQMSKAVGVFIASGIFTAMAAGLIDAFRDDDFDEQYWQKWLKSLGITTKKSTPSEIIKTWMFGNIMDNVNPLNMIPIAKDVLSKVQGFDAERIDLAGVFTAVDAVNALNEYLANPYASKKTSYGITKQMLRAFSQLSGVPAYNLLRDTEAVVENIRKEKFEERKSGGASGIMDEIITEEANGGFSSNKHKRLMKALEKEMEVKEDETFDSAFDSRALSKTKSRYKSGEINEGTTTTLLRKHGMEDEAIDSYFLSQARSAYKENPNSTTKSKLESELRDNGKTDSEIFKYFETVDNGKVYQRIFNEIDTGTVSGVDSVINDYLDHGVSPSSIYSGVTNAYKENWHNLSNKEQNTIWYICWRTWQEKYKNGEVKTSYPSAAAYKAAKENKLSWSK